MRRPFSSITYSILALVLAFSICADFWMYKNGVPFSFAYLGPLFFAGLVVLYILAIEASTVVPEKPAATDAKKEPAPSAASGALLALDSAAEKTFSAAWMNTLCASYGPYETAAPGSLLKAAEGKTVIVIPSREAAQVVKDKASADALIALAEKGAAIIIDSPSGEAAELLGLGPENFDVSAPSAWTYPGILPDGLAKDLAGCPAPINFKTRDFHKGGYAVWMRAGDHAAVVGKAAGAGGIVITLFDWAKYLTKLKQGAIEGGLSSAITGATTSKLAIPELYGNTTPYADLLDAFISGLAGHFSPCASWWPHPGGAKSSLLLSVDDDGVGRRLNEALAPFKKAGAAPTVFSASASRALKDSISAISQTQSAAALLWNRFSSKFAGPNSKSGAPGGLSSQAALINSLLAADSPVRTVRAMGLRWDGEAEDNFELMASAGVETDCSFGPGPRDGGYTFATGFPFHPVTASGRPAKILEIPFQVEGSRPGAATDRAEDLIENAASHNSPVSVSFSARGLIQSERARERARELVEAASSLGLNLSSPDAFAAFWKSRASSPISASRSDAILLIVADAKSDGLFIRVPLAMRGAGALSAISADGEAFALSSLLNGNLLPAKKGLSKVVLTYSKP